VTGVAGEPGQYRKLPLLCRGIQLWHNVAQFASRNIYNQLSELVGIVGTLGTTRGHGCHLAWPAADGKRVKFQTGAPNARAGFLGAFWGILAVEANWKGAAAVAAGGVARRGDRRRAGVPRNSICSRASSRRSSTESRPIRRSGPKPRSSSPSMKVADPGIRAMSSRSISLATAPAFQ
jgi:hypothetical protein